MALDHRDSPGDETDHDFIEALPVIGRRATQLERSLGPSCLLSLVIVLLLLLALGRWFHVEFEQAACLAVLIWVGVLTLLVRWRGGVFPDDDE